MSNRDTSIKHRFFLFSIWAVTILSSVFSMLLYGTDLFLNDRLFADYAAHASFWFILALIPSAFLYLIDGSSWVSNSPAANMYSAFCIANMFIPILSYMFIDGHYAYSDTENLAGAYKISALVFTVFYIGIRYDLFDLSTCHCDSKS